MVMPEIISKQQYSPLLPVGGDQTAISLCVGAIMVVVMVAIGSLFYRMNGSIERQRIDRVFFTLSRCDGDVPNPKLIDGISYRNANDRVRGLSPLEERLSMLENVADACKPGTALPPKIKGIAVSLSRDITRVTEQNMMKNRKEEDEERNRVLIREERRAYNIYD